MTKSSTPATPASLGLSFPDPDKLQRIIDANLNGQLDLLQLPRVTTPAAGATTWTIPTLDGTTTSDTIVGVILHVQSVRVYWSSRLGEGDPFPSCTSADAIRGVGNPGGMCSECPLTDWGSNKLRGADSNAQACSEQRAILLLEPGHVLPTIVRVPPSAIGIINSYTTRLAAVGFLIYDVVTQIGLKPAKNRSGIPYSEPTFSVLNELDPIVADIMEQYRSSFVAALQAKPAWTPVLEAATQE